MAESGRKLEFEAPPLSRKQQKSVSWVELTQDSLWSGFCRS